MYEGFTPQLHYLGALACFKEAPFLYSFSQTNVFTRILKVLFWKYLFSVLFLRDYYHCFCVQLGAHWRDSPRVCDIHHPLLGKSSIFPALLIGFVILSWTQSSSFYALNRVTTRSKEKAKRKSKNTCTNPRTSKCRLSCFSVQMLSIYRYTTGAIHAVKNRIPLKWARRQMLILQAFFLQWHVKTSAEEDSSMERGPCFLPINYMRWYSLWKRVKAFTPNGT